RTDWGVVFGQGGLLLGGLIVLLLFGIQSLGTTIGDMGAQGQQGILKAIILGAFVVLMVGGVVWQGNRIGWPYAWRAGVLALLLVLFAYEVRSATMASFRNGATPVEMLVYTQSAPDTAEVATR